MKVGIVTYVKADNYGAELQAYAMQYVLNKFGYDAEVIDLEKKTKDLSKSPRNIVRSIVNRFKLYGLVRGFQSVYKLINTKIRLKLSQKQNASLAEKKHRIFIDFFDAHIKHSQRYYTYDDMYSAKFEYNAFVAGSDQIWNYMHTDHLDVFFLMFVQNPQIKKVSYAASLSVPHIPSSLVSKYKQYINHLDSISVRELKGQEILQQLTAKKVECVLDPTLLISKEEWVKNVANPNYIEDNRYVVIYTLSGSTYIYNLAKKIAKELNAEVVNIKDGYLRVKGDDGIKHLYDVGPREFISLFSKAVYVITDSFHGTAFSINFNIPFTTLVNPVSNMNSRVMSILTITNLKGRIIYDDGQKREPNSLKVDFSPVNDIIGKWRMKSVNFLKSSLN